MPDNCVQLPGHQYFACIIPEGFLYWANGAFTNMFYWHPSVPGNVVVNSVYYKDSAPGYVHGPQWTKRLITLATGVMVLGFNVTVADVNPPAPTKGVNWVTGEIRDLTPLEQESVLNYWKAAQNVPGNDW